MLRFLAILLLVASTGIQARGVTWLTDLNMALDQAKRENKTVLVDFTGSDWCPWCKRLQSDVFDQPQFAEYAQEHLVLLLVDFPHNHTLPRDQQKANYDLMKSFGVGSFPTIYLISSEGKRQAVYGGDLISGPAAFIEGVERSRSLFGPKRASPEPEAPSPAPIPAPKTYRPPGPVRPVNYGALKLKSISGAKGRRIVLINNASLMVGESAKIRSNGKDVQVTCKEILDDSVLITCDGKSMKLKFAAK
ncbi:MAG TPA: thioredoxin fold domain-containing protein [Verrucomicrobiae bacterium]|nr:thioredoxin fold domain-containing protein [Verrucomicrobiae bacterium]